MNHARHAAWLRIPLSLGLAMLVWQCAYWLHVAPEKYFPSLTRIGTAFFDMLGNGDLLAGESKTFSRALLGLVGASIVGAALAVLSDISPLFGRGFRYISDVLQPIPPAAFVPMAVFSLGLGWKLYAFVIILVTIWPPYINGVSALASVSPVQLDTGRMLGCGKWEQLWRIKWPAALPEIFAGIRYAATLSLIAVIVSEMLAGRDGLGFMIFKKAFALRTPEVFALMFLVGVNGMILNGLVFIARRWATGWHMRMMEPTS